jgi:hypothetical protein
VHSHQIHVSLYLEKLQGEGVSVLKDLAKPKQRHVLQVVPNVRLRAGTVAAIKSTELVIPVASMASDPIDQVHALPRCKSKDNHQVWNSLHTATCQAMRLQAS